MSKYIEEVKSLLRARLSGYSIVEKSPSVFQIVKGNTALATVKDQGENVIIVIKGQEYRYDKFYTKPEHLANVLANYFKQAG